MTVPTLWEQGQALLACAVTELDAKASATIEGAPARRYFSPNLPAYDDCCEDGGQLWVRVIKAHPVNPIPTKVLTEVPCRHTIGVQLAVGVIRCAHTMDDQGGDPTIAEMSDDARQVVSDMGALLRALACCVAEDADNRATTLDQWTPIDPSGGCVGGEWSFWWTPRIDIPEEGS